LVRICIYPQSIRLGESYYGQCRSLSSRCTLHQSARIDESGRNRARKGGAHGQILLLSKEGGSCLFSNFSCSFTTVVTLRGYSSSIKELQGSFRVKPFVFSIGHRGVILTGKLWRLNNCDNLIGLHFVTFVNTDLFDISADFGVERNCGVRTRFSRQR